MRSKQCQGKRERVLARFRLTDDAPKAGHFGSRNHGSSRREQLSDYAVYQELIRGCQPINGEEQICWLALWLVFAPT